MDVLKYSELKASGVLSIAKVGNVFFAAIKRWDSATGVEIDPETTQLDIEDLQSRQATLQAEIDAIDIVIADCQAL